MSAQERRLLDPALLPVSIWEPASQTLLLPPILAKAYKTVIDRHNLRELAESRDPKNPPIGGLDKKKLINILLRHLIHRLLERNWL